MTLAPGLKIGLWNAWLFMCVFLIQMMVIMLFDKRIWEKSHVPRDERKKGLERYVGIIGNFFWLLALGYSIFLPLQVGTGWFYIGLSVFVIGLLLMAVATFNFLSTPPEGLINKGAYKLSRHPMYLATFLICIGAGFAGISLLLVFFSLVMIVCFRQEALIEERLCLKKYGEKYQQYMQSVPRWMGVPKGIR